MCMGGDREFVEGKAEMWQGWHMGRALTSAKKWFCAGTTTSLGSVRTVEPVMCAGMSVKKPTEPVTPQQPQLWGKAQTRHSAAIFLEKFGEGNKILQG